MMGMGFERRSVMLRKRMYDVVVPLSICLVLGASFFNASVAEAQKITLKAISAWDKQHTRVVGDYLPYIKRANEMLQTKYPGEVEIEIKLLGLHC
jgi:hypothetical protein